MAKVRKIWQSVDSALDHVLDMLVRLVVVDRVVILSFLIITISIEYLLGS